MEALRSTTVVLLCGDEALQGPGQELQSRIAHLLQREPSSELSLSRIGQDRCVQRLLRGRSLRDFVQQQQQQQRMAGARDTCWDIRKGEHDVVLRQLPTQTRGEGGCWLDNRLQVTPGERVLLGMVGCEPVEGCQ